MGLKYNEINKNVLVLEHKAKLLQKLHFIRKMFLSNGAYHEKNLETQIKTLEQCNAPQTEIDLITKSNDILSRLSKDIMTEYEKIINEIETLYRGEN